MKTKINFSNFIPLLALPTVIFIPQFGKLFSPYTAWILGILMFFSFLSLDLKKIVKEFRHPLEPFYMAMVILVVTPLLVIPIMTHFFPAYKLGALLFMLSPSAIAAPAVAGLYGGSIALAAINTIFSSILAPFSIPILITFFAGTTVKVSILKMMFQLVTIIFIPFILSLLTSHYSEKVTEKVKKHNKYISLGLLFLIFLAILSPYKAELIENFLNKTLWLAVVVAHLILLFFAKMLTVNVESKRRRVSMQSNLLFLNVGIGIIIAQNYFGPSEVLFIVFCQIVWVVMVSLFKYIK
jgi:BASS family bile acid:Na+ symporter